MWNLLRGTPICPVEPELREWIDARFRWLEEQFGVHAPRQTRVVLPTTEFFPDSFAGNPDDAQTMLRRVADYMGIASDRFQLYFYDNDRDKRTRLQLKGGDFAAGLYHREGGHDAKGPAVARIGLDVANLADPMALVAVLAHEIGHELLLGEGRVSPEQDDHEPLTDLLVVFKGLGIFNANATITDRGWTAGGWTGWRTGRLGYLNQRSFGYALARFARARDEPWPRWMKHVRLDVRVAMKQALRFLDRQ